MNTQQSLTLEEAMIKRVTFGKCQILYHVVFYGMTIVAGFYSCSFGIILPVIQRDRNLTQTQVTIINSGQFIAQFLSSILFLFYLEGFLGRKNAVLLINLGVTIALFMIQYSDNFNQILGYILMYNMFIGSSSTNNSLYITELNSSDIRTQMQILLLLSWPVGMLITTLICLLGFNAHLVGDQWRVLFLIDFYFSLVPLVINIFLLVESPRYLFYQQEFDRAITNLNFMGKINNSSFVPFNEEEKKLLVKWSNDTFRAGEQSKEVYEQKRLTRRSMVSRLSAIKHIPVPIKKKKEGFSTLFNKTYRERTIQLALIRFLQKLLYYGQTIMIPTILHLKNQSEKGNHQANQKQEDKEISHYMTLLLTISMEFPANFIAQKLLKKYKRKQIIPWSFIITAVFNILSSMLDNLPLTISLALTNFCSVILQTSVQIYVSEVYQIQVRSLASGFLNISSSLGAIAMPWVFQFSIQFLGNSGPLYTYAILNFIGFLISTQLKKELTRKSMIDRPTFIKSMELPNKNQIITPLIIEAGTKLNIEKMYNIIEENTQEEQQQEYVDELDMFDVDVRKEQRMLSCLGGDINILEIYEYHADDPLQQNLQEEILIRKLSYEEIMEDNQEQLNQNQ